MSLTALAVVAVQVAVVGSAPEPDEGAGAHLWQILMAGQIPVVAFFAVRWIPRSPRAAGLVLLSQLTLAAGAVAPVWLLGW